MRVGHHLETHPRFSRPHRPLLGASLRIGIDEEDFETPFAGENSGEIHGKGCLPASTFLVCYRDYGRHSISLPEHYFVVNR